MKDVRVVVCVSVVTLLKLFVFVFIAKDPQGATKRIKLKIWDVVNLPIGERVIVPFDEQNTPYGEAQALLAGYCGILATNHQLFPINFERWNGETGMPKAYKDNCFATDLKVLLFIYGFSFIY